MHIWGSSLHAFLIQKWEIFNSKEGFLIYTQDKNKKRDNAEETRKTKSTKNRTGKKR